MPWCSFVLLSLLILFAVSERRDRSSKHLDRVIAGGVLQCDFWVR